MKNIKQYDNLPIINALINKAKNKPISFHTPGHKHGNSLHPKFKEILNPNYLQYDLTELQGLDILSNPQGIIAESQKIASDKFGSDTTFYLINGITSGIQASILATTINHHHHYHNYKEEIDSIVILSRNCHESTLKALALINSKPYYIIPEYDSKNKIHHCINPEILYVELKKLINKYIINAVVITSPTCFGSISKINELSDICHDFGIPLIVDETYGIHLSCHETFPLNAIQNGADVAIQSLHTNQTALLHLKSNLIKASDIQQSLNIINTTSPSYLLMASIEAEIYNMDNFGNALLLKKLIENSVEKISSSLNFIHNDINCHNELNSIQTYDPLRLCLNVSKWHLNGNEIANILENEYSIIPELSNQELIVFVLDKDATSPDCNKLTSALNQKLNNNYNEIYNFKIEKPQVIMTPREVFFSKKQNVNLKDCLGEISSDNVILHSYGMPVICAGELITQKIQHQLFSINNKNLNGSNLKTINIVKN